VSRLRAFTSSPRFKKAYGRVDVLVNNAGIMIAAGRDEAAGQAVMQARVETAAPDEWR